MKLEHLALNVEDPVRAAKWYCDNLGFSILKEMDVSPFHHFIADPSKSVMLEIFLLPDKKLQDYRSLDPAIMHLGFLVEDIEEEYQKLQLAGAEVVNKILTSKNGDMVAMLRDPWGVPIQLIKRKQQLIKNISV